MANDACGKLHIWGLGLALGTLWGVGLLLLGLGSVWCEGWGGEFIEAMGSIYPGYTTSYLGSLLGLIWGFVDAFIAGVVMAWLYNCVSEVCSSRRTKKT